MAVFFMALTDKEKMLGFALRAHGVRKEALIEIMMLLTLEDEQDDMAWFLGENPKVDEALILRVALQLDKESREKGLKQ